MAELTGAIVGYTGSTSVVNTTPFPYRKGTRGRDLDGSEYIYCDFVDTIYGRQPVVVNSDYTASILTVGGGHQGNLIGVACTGGTSDNGGWVQVFGRCLMQVGINGASPSDAANGPTTVRTTVGTLFIIPTSLTSPMVLGYTSAYTSDPSLFVRGITVATDASVGDSSAVTSATSHIGAEIGVFLNYPSVIMMHGTS